MAEPSPTETALIARRSRHEGALDAALERLAPGPAGRPDTPDQHVTALRRLPAVAAQFVPFPAVLDARLTRAFESRGVTQLYTHQAQAINHALAARNVVIVTPTASGKTLCYNAPILHSILQDPSSRALYLFPTKALAQDQLAELQGLCETLAASAGDQIGVFTYDGDTPQDARRTIRAKAHLVLSNPDMLHSGILPHHPRWAKLFENLRYVVIDELHAYRGVFGSHLCNVLRRLRRICRHYGSNPVFICSSATIANPRELAERLAEQPFELVDKSGAPRGEKYFVFVNPPVVNHQLGIRRSYLSETRRIASEFLRRNLQLIVFAQSRLSTEILTTYLKDDFEEGPGGAERIRGYRGGYLPGRRRDIEKGLREGAVSAVVSTSALELGIDIGALDVAVMAGYPGTIAATWQRAGRAGRRSGRSAAVLVASSAPLDQFMVRNPSYFFNASPERALIDPDNLHILVDHVKCAAFELPFTGGEQFGRHDLQEILSVLAEQGLVHTGASGDTTWTNESYPADAVSLRSVSSDNFVIVDTTTEPRVIGETDFTSGPATLHPKAIYLVEGKLFQVEKLDFEGRKAFVREIDCDYYTDAITHTRVTMLDTFAAHPTSAHGEVHVVSRVVGFKKIKFYTNENVGSGELDLPEQQMHTTSYWLTVPAAVMALLPYAPDDRRDGVVGLSFAMRQVAQLLLMCDRHDIGISIDAESGLGSAPLSARVFIYDNYPGGIGFSEPLFRMHRELVDGTRRLIAECECENGCPGCVGPVGYTGPLAKTAALRILDLLLTPELAAGGGEDGVTVLGDRLREIVGPAAPGASLRPSSLRASAGGLEAALGGEWTPDERSFIVERRVSPGTWHGRVRVEHIAAAVHRAAGEAPLFGAGARPPFYFFDLETTGLSGGAGTHAFLVGYGWFAGDGTWVTRQHLLPRYELERPMLEGVEEALSGAGALVSFNGKSFDAPVLETRYLYHRLEWAGSCLPHIDVLHPARRFWGDRGGSERGCSLGALEQQILGARREDDVPGYEIPSRYFQFVRTGDARPLSAVFEHNRQDLLSLAGLAGRLLSLAADGPAGARDAREALALGRLYARAGLDGRAREAFQHAAGATPVVVDAQIDALLALAAMLRRGRQFDEAARCWRQVLEIPACPRHVVLEASEALAIHHEHRVRDLAAAKSFALQSLESMEGRDNIAVRHRLARLDRKLTTASSGRPLFPSWSSRPLSCGSPTSGRRTSS